MSGADNVVRGACAIHVFPSVDLRIRHTAIVAGNSQIAIRQPMQHLHFEAHDGHGPHLLLLHGFLMSRAQWRLEPRRTFARLPAGRCGVVGPRQVGRTGRSERLSPRRIHRAVRTHPHATRHRSLVRLRVFARRRPDDSLCVDPSGPRHRPRVHELDVGVRRRRAGRCVALGRRRGGAENRRRRHRRDRKNAGASALTPSACRPICTTR